jgi:hypothetical protein
MKIQLAGLTVYNTDWPRKIKRWLRTRRRHRCRECQHFGENWLNAQDGQGLYRFGFCWEKVHDTVLVDGDIPRSCPLFKKRKKIFDPLDDSPPAGSGAATPGSVTGMPGFRG